MTKSLSSAVVVSFLLAGCITAPDPAGQSDLQGEGMVRTEVVDYGPTRGYLALPEGDGPHPALILIHEFWGLNDNIRWYAEEFAKQGYAALAVDLYEGESTQDAARARELAGAVRANVDPAFANLRAAVDYLRSRSDVDSNRLASVGWCFGGGWSYQMAKNDLGVRTSVMYYGQFAPEDDLSMMKALIIGHFGEEDQGIPVDDVKAFRARLKTLNGDHQIFIYENVGHGFARELETESARTAWQRTLEFLGTYL
ncbi:hypothetical protein AUJ46_02255 [Candidatus Peregrinibacteria bacterium CG1_02_54_53]|nr:MAG: hypothetical protein AUJ46_02255 [Candidatus Peregrinibacteria bacterium CG1_02_54_53]